MKDIVFFIAILFSIFLNAQDKDDKVGLFSIHPFHHVEITLRDGTFLEGLGRINFEKQIVFKTNENLEKIIYDHAKVSTLRVINNDENSIYKNKILEGSGGYAEYLSRQTYGPNMRGGYDF